MNRINKFRGEYFFLSNFYNAPVMYNGLTFQNNEAAFQSAKVIGTKYEKQQSQFTKLDPKNAKHKGRHVQLRDDWDKVKNKVMYDIVKDKFTRNQDLKQKLLDTGNNILEEGNTWHDTYWGVDSKLKYGNNQLGKILMQVRRELREN